MWHEDLKLCSEFCLFLLLKWREKNKCEQAGYLNAMKIWKTARDIQSDGGTNEEIGIEYTIIIVVVVVSYCIVGCYSLNGFSFFSFAYVVFFSVHINSILEVYLCFCGCILLAWLFSCVSVFVRPLYSTLKNTVWLFLFCTRLLHTHSFFLSLCVCICFSKPVSLCSSGLSSTESLCKLNARLFLSTVTLKFWYDVSNAFLTPKQLTTRMNGFFLLLRQIKF